MDSFFGIHSLIPFLKATTLVNLVNSKSTISQILKPKHEILSLPWKTDPSMENRLFIIRPWNIQITGQ